MTHEEFQQNLIDYVAERLSAEESRQLEAHLAACEECADFVSDLRPLPQLMTRHGEALFDEHPEPEELRRHRGGTGGSVPDRIERHLAVCAPCRLQTLPLPELPARHAAPETAPIPRAGRRAPRIVETTAMLAAGLVLGLMLGYLARQPIPTHDGPIDLPVLDRMTRGPGEVTRIQVRDGQEAVVIAVPIDALDARTADERVLVQVATSSGSLIYELEESAGALRRKGATGILTLLIDSPRLPPGSYEVVIRAPGDDGQPIAAFPFETVGVSGK